MIYLASPFAHPDAEVRNARLVASEDASHWLLQHNLPNFAPIAHNARAAERLDPLRASSYFMLAFAILDTCSSMYILDIDGWKTSRGVLLEIGYALSREMDLFMIRKTGYGDYFTLPISPGDLINRLYSSEE